MFKNRNTTKNQKKEIYSHVAIFSNRMNETSERNFSSCFEGVSVYNWPAFLIDEYITETDPEKTLHKILLEDRNVCRIRVWKCYVALYSTSTDAEVRSLKVSEGKIASNFEDEQSEMLIVYHFTYAGETGDCIVKIFCCMLAEDLSWEQFSLRCLSCTGPRDLAT